jgi:hypothetical protein
VETLALLRGSFAEQSGVETLALLRGSFAEQSGVTKLTTHQKVMINEMVIIKNEA